MPKWDDYSIRSTAYYLKQGGVYSQLLTILMNMRSTFQHRGIRPAYVILNSATYFCDCYKQTGNFDKEKYECNPILDRYVILILILSTYPDTDKQMVIDEYQLLNSFAKKYQKYFEKLWIQVLNNKTVDNSIAITSEEIKDNSQADEILALKANLQDAQKTIEEQQKTIQNLNNTTANSIDKYFTLEILIDYVRSRRHYHNSLQIINMIKDLLRGCNDKAIWDKVDAMEQEMLEKDQPHSIINNNNITGSNVITGLVNNPKFPIGVDPMEFIDSAIKEKLNSLQV